MSRNKSPYFPVWVHNVQEVQWNIKRKLSWENVDSSWQTHCYVSSLSFLLDQTIVHRCKKKKKWTGKQNVKENGGRYDKNI